MKKTFILFIAGMTILFSSLHALEIWEKSPGFKLEKAGSDGSVTFDELASGGSVIVLSFFDTKCEPCLKELPSLKKLYARYLDDSKIKIRMISLDEDADVLKDYIKKHDVTIPVLRDPGGWKAGSNYGVVRSGRAEIPQIFVIGKNGKIRKHIRGYHEDIDIMLTKTIEHLKIERINKPKISKLTIIYTNSANGYLESCDCPENPFGGFVRRITAINRLKKTYSDTILIDSGDNFPVRENKLLAEYVLRMMEIIDYDAVAVGDQEMILGIDYLEKNIKRINFLAANISRCDDVKCWDIADHYKIKEVSGLKIGIIGITNPGVFMFFPQDKIEGVKIENHIPVLQGIVSSLKQQTDIIVLVSHSGDEEDKKIAQEVPGIDIIVGGHSQTFHKEPAQIGDTLIVQAGKDGHRVGRLTLTIGPDNNIISHESEMILLIKEVQDDPAARKLIDEYKIEVKKEAGKVLIK
ncbi:MAG: redoxin domain-containing protein [Elusimicrobiota bacterium]